MSISSVIRSGLQVVTDVVSDHPVLAVASIVGVIGAGYHYVNKKNNKAQEEVDEMARDERARAQSTAQSQQYAKKPEDYVQAQAKKQSEKPEPEVIDPEVEDDKPGVFDEKDLYTLNVEEMLKKPKIARVVEQFDEMYNKDFPLDLAEATEQMCMNATLRMSDLANKSMKFDVSRMRHDDLTTISRQTNAQARLSMRYTNHIHCTRTFVAKDKAQAKLILALVATSILRDHQQYIGGEMFGATEAIALIDECFSRGCGEVYFYETTVMNAVDERDRQVIEHQVRIMIDVNEDYFAQTVVF